MPRGQRKTAAKTTDELLDEVNQEIVKCQTLLNEAKDRKKELEKQKKEEEKEKLFAAAATAAKASGKSVEQIIQDIVDQNTSKNS